MIRTGITTSSVLAGLPPPWPHDLLPRLRGGLGRSYRKVWVLDDDPTGTQTITDLPVLTHWDVPGLRAEFADPAPGCFILTNSRALTAAGSAALHRELAANLHTAAAGRPFTLISRSDSTLRGHFPLETDTLSEVLGGFDLTLLAPFFEAGGRLTLDDVHYLTAGDHLVPVGDTPFARDASFGYRASSIPRWVEEKSGGRVRAADVVSLPLSFIRQNGPDAVAQRLLSAPRGAVVVANAVTQSDIEVVAAAVMATETAGRRILARTAASYVAARLGQRPAPLLSGRECAPVSTGTGGLIVAGSHVPETTAQLKHLCAHSHNLAVLDLPVPILLDPAEASAMLDLLRDELNAALAAGRDTLLQTSRELVRGDDGPSSLAIGQTVSQALVTLVRGLTQRPHFLIAKGGITSSDLATQAVGVRRSLVRGQLLPGVPVWTLGPETRFPGLGYVVFPGNVGGTSALTDAVTKLNTHPP